MLHTPDESSFQPINKLNRTDADISLVHLLTWIDFHGPMPDPWFLSMVPDPHYNTNGGVSNDPLYSRDWDNPLTTVACAEQHQVCNPAASGGRQCTNLTGLYDVLAQSASNIGLTPRQKAIVDRSVYPAWDNFYGRALYTLGGEYLITSKYVFGGESPADVLGPEPWKEEFSNWFGMNLVSMQIESREYVIGPIEQSWYQYIEIANDTSNKWMCNNQIARRDDYSSFSILGICIILCIGGCMISLNVVGPFLWRRYQARTPDGRMRNTEWLLEGNLQLHRLAFENNGKGRWFNTHGATPIAPDQQFSVSGLRRQDTEKPSPEYKSSTESRRDMAEETKKLDIEPDRPMSDQGTLATSQPDTPTTPQALHEKELT